MWAMCTLDFCDRPGRNANGAGLCEAHYYQQRRGRPLVPIQERTGSEGDPCDAEGCGEPRRRGRFCPKHAARMARHGDPSVVVAPADRDMPRGPANPMWTDAPTYHTVHERLRRQRGQATGYPCASCGGPAAHWAYTGPREPGEKQPWSTDLEHYASMCVPCHKAFDLAAG